MPIAHFTLATRDVAQTSAFLEAAFSWRPVERPNNVPRDANWLDVGRGQELHLLRVDGFEISPFEAEFGRHFAFFHPLADFDGLKSRLAEQGAELIDPIRETPFERFFFRDPVNGYIFEIIEDSQAPRSS
ncbi:MAG: VOC family protein [Planctomycetota bacterium]